MLTALLSLVLADPDARAGCGQGQCPPAEGAGVPAGAADTDAVSSSLTLRPDAHLRTATFALG